MLLTAYIHVYLQRKPKIKEFKDDNIVIKIRIHAVKSALFCNVGFIIIYSTQVNSNSHT